MAQKRQSLFRQAAMEEQVSTGIGEVLLVVPPSARYLIIGTGAATIFACAFLCFVTFSRNETVTGTLRVASRPVQLLAPSPGTVDKVLVKEGDIVDQGALLAVISKQTIMEGGRSLESIQIAALDRVKDALLQRQAKLEKRHYLAKEKLRSLPAPSEEKLNLVQTIEDSQSEVDIKLAEVESDRARLQSSSQVELRAPISGRVSHLKYTAGDSLLAGDRMLFLAPTSSAMVAELYVPVETIAFLKINHKVSLSFDPSLASDYEAFEGQIESISESLIPQDEMKQLGLNHLAYLVTIKLDEKTVTSLIESYPSVYSLNIKGSVPLPKRRLWDWVVDPAKKSSKSQENYEAE